MAKHLYKNYAGDSSAEELTTERFYKHHINEQLTEGEIAAIYKNSRQWVNKIKLLAQEELEGRFRKINVFVPNRIGKKITSSVEYIVLNINYFREHSQEESYNEYLSEGNKKIPYKTWLEEEFIAKLKKYDEIILLPDGSVFGVDKNNYTRELISSCEFGEDGLKTFENITRKYADSIIYRISKS